MKERVEGSQTPQDPSDRLGIEENLLYLFKSRRLFLSIPVKEQKEKSRREESRSDIRVMWSSHSFKSQAVPSVRHKAQRAVKQHIRSRTHTSGSAF